MSNTYPEGPSLAELSGCANPGNPSDDKPVERTGDRNAELAANPVVKFCLDCKWLFVPLVGGVDVAECHAPQNHKDPSVNLVTGKSESLPIMQYADNQRKYAMGNNCGPSGAWWVRK